MLFSNTCLKGYRVVIFIIVQNELTYNFQLFFIEYFKILKIQIEKEVDLTQVI